MSPHEPVKLVRADDGSGVVLSPSTGKYFKLNATAAEVLEMTLDGMTFDGVVNRLAEKFPAADKAAISQDAEAIIGDFRTRGWVTA